MKSSLTFCCLVISALVFCNRSFANVDIQLQEKALSILSNFSKEICVMPPLGGESENISLSGQANVKLGGLIKIITDLGVEGAAKYKSEKYQGPLRKDLAKLLLASSDCRLEVWKDLKDKLLGARNNMDHGNISTLFTDIDYLLAVRTKGEYEGEIKNSLPDGFGHLVIKYDHKLILSYDGDFKHGVFHGSGILTHYDVQGVTSNHLDGLFNLGCFVRGNADVNYRDYNLPSDVTGSGWGIKGNYVGEVSVADHSSYSIGSNGNRYCYYDDLASNVVPEGKGTFTYKYS